MKKKLIHSAVLTALLSASSIALAGGPDVIIPEPDYFSGFYVGGIGGVHHNTFNGSSNVNLTQPIVAPFPIFGPQAVILDAGTLNSTDVSGGEYNGYGGVQGGFGKVINHQYYVGLQGWGEWGSSSETNTTTTTAPLGSFFIPLTPLFVTPTASASTSTTVKISNDSGIAGKFGWVVAPRSMIYGKVGASWADIKVSNSANVNTSTVTTVGQGGIVIATGNTFLTGSASSSDNNKLGLLLGVGFEQFVYQDIVSINVEADYTNYGSVDSNSAELAGATTLGFPSFPAPFSGPFTFLRNNTNIFTSASSDVQVSSLMAGLNFYFGRDWM